MPNSNREKSTSQRVQDIFTRVAPCYDRMNDLMSLGQHTAWKKAFVESFPWDNLLAQPKPLQILDLASGTGDIAKLTSSTLEERSLPFSLTASDLNPEMLEAGRKKHPEAPWKWIIANGCSLPFKEKSFNLVTVAFGLRNMPCLLTALKEAHRILKPEGFYYCLEFSQATNPYLKGLYSLYAHTWIPFLAHTVAKDPEAYAYLVESIEAFPGGPVLQELFKSAGFENTGFKPLSGGIVTIHWGQRSV